jgi:hypothetical protein
MWKDRRSANEDPRRLQPVHRTDWAARCWLAKQGYDVQYGARLCALQRFIGRVGEMLKGEFKVGDTILVMQG